MISTSHATLAASGLASSTTRPLPSTSGFGSSPGGRLPKYDRSILPQETEAEKKLRSVGEKLVGQVFLAPMFQQMRNSPFKDTMFSGGRGGEAFSSLLDQQLISRASGGSLGRGIVDSLVDRFRGLANSAETRNQQLKAAAEDAVNTARSVRAAPQPSKGTDAHVNLIG